MYELAALCCTLSASSSPSPLIGTIAIIDDRAADHRR
jgi:hypothetical protein